MIKLYVIRREDLFEAISKGQIPEDCFHEGGSIWCVVKFTDEQKNNYKYPIDLAY